MVWAGEGPLSLAYLVVPEEEADRAPTREVMIDVQPLADVLLTSARQAVSLQPSHRD
jgi:hypothetical protein